MKSGIASSCVDLLQKIAYESCDIITSAAWPEAIGRLVKYGFRVVGYRASRTIKLIFLAI